MLPRCETKSILLNACLRWWVRIILWTNSEKRNIFEISEASKYLYLVKYNNSKKLKIHISLSLCLNLQTISKEDLPEFFISFSVAKVKESIILETRELKVVTSSIFEKSWLEPEILTFDEMG
jgi:hypothetical protein